MKNIIIVPSWIQRVLAREKMSVKEILNYSKLCDIFSTTDIRAILLAQSYEPLKAYHITDQDNKALLNIWKKNIDPKKVTEIDAIVNDGVNSHLDKDHFKFLINGEVREENSKKVFEVLPGDNNTLLLVLHSGYFGSQDYEDQDANVIENIISVLYGECVQEDIARTPIFKRYVKILSNKYS